MNAAIHFAGSDFMLSTDDLQPDLLEALLACGAQGDASDAVACVRSQFEVTGDETDCADMLRGYGAWDDEELADHYANLDRLIWLTGCDLREQGEAYFSTY